MKINLVSVLLLGALWASSSLAQSPGAEPEGLQTGGSNFVMFDVGAYASGYADEQFNPHKPNPPTLFPVIGSFHLQPDRVKRMMTAMRASGQRKIAFLLWHGPMYFPTSTHVVYHFVDSKGGQLIPQHQANLKELMKLVRQIGFEEVQFRFGTWGTANPGNPDPVLPGNGPQGYGGWQSWNEGQYQENWRFIVSTRQIIEGVLNGSSVRRWYDLAAEDGGQVGGQRTAYVRRLWSDYVKSFGKADSYASSVAFVPGRLKELIKTLDGSGAGRPEFYSVDVYDGMYDSLRAVASELKSAGELQKPVLIQETFYNDPVVRDQVDRAMRDFGLKIRSIMQWPLTRGGKQGVGINMHAPLDYNLYLKNTNSIYTNGFEAETSFGNGWTTWQNGATASGGVARFEHDENSLDGGRWALRLTSGVYNSAAQFPGLYVESPPISVRPGAKVDFSVMIKSSDAKGGVVLIAMDEKGREVLHSQEVAIPQGPWAFRQIPIQLIAPSSVVRIKARIFVTSPNSIIDVDQVRLTSGVL